MEKKIGLSQRGNPQLTLNGYSYYKDYTVKSGQKVWACCEKSCKAKVTTIGDTEEIITQKSNLEHNHGAAAKRAVARLKVCEADEPSSASNEKGDPMSWKLAERELKLKISSLTDAASDRKQDPGKTQSFTGGKNNGNNERPRKVKASAKTLGNSSSSSPRKLKSSEVSDSPNNNLPTEFHRFSSPPKKVCETKAIKHADSMHKEEPPILTKEWLDAEWRRISDGRLFM